MNETDLIVIKKVDINTPRDVFEQMPTIDLTITLFGDPWTMAEFQSFDNIIIATVKDKVGGYLVYEYQGQTQDCIHIYNLGVDLLFQNQGIGTKLLSFLIRMLKNDANAKSITLEVAVQNENALKLYKKMGFVTEHFLSNYYGPGQDAYFARLNLQEI
jgi:ribosomal protein S18 acetylase RimI-like enzyme